MPVCTVCQQTRARLKFKTKRLSICSYCVSSLNNTALSPREAKAKWVSGFRDNLFRRHEDADRWADRWLASDGDRILLKQLADPGSVKRSPELKILRAYRIGLLCLDRRMLDYPQNWEFKRFRTKTEDGLTCKVCGARESDNAELHVHHIVFRSNSGTNSYRNLVTLCLKHHQQQHDHPISSRGGEPRGADTDSPGNTNSELEDETERKVDFEIDVAGIAAMSHEPVPEAPLSTQELRPQPEARSENQQLEAMVASPWSAPHVEPRGATPTPPRSTAKALPDPERLPLPMPSHADRANDRAPIARALPKPVMLSPPDSRTDTRWILVVGIMLGVMFVLTSINQVGETPMRKETNHTPTVDAEPREEVPVPGVRSLSDEEQAQADYAAEYARLVRAHPELRTNQPLADEIADERDRLMNLGQPGHVALRNAAAAVLGKRTDANP